MSGFGVGDRFAGYELLELVGEGRMGQVYQALQPRLERVVAVKVIRPELVADERSRERFRREMRIAASIDHPNVIPVYEVDEQDGALFAAMRWVDGSDLGRLLAERGRLDPTQAVRIVARVAAALEAAHGVGLFHRDLKPSNVLLEGDRVYLTDFGLAAVGDSGTDVDALGRMLYEMLTGSAPVPSDPAPASRLRDGLPPAIDPVLRRAVVADPAERYRTPTQFVEAVEGALAGSLDGQAPRRRRRRRLLALGAVALVIAAAAVAVVLATSGGDGGDNGSAQAKDPGGRTLPAAATLPPCGKTFSGPPRECRSKTGGYEAIADIDKPLRLETLNFTVHRVRQAAKLSDSNGAAFTAPPGIRFIVIDATITNLTDKAEEFEPNNLFVEGRETAFWLFNENGKIAAYRSKDGEDDYSVQYDTVLSTLQDPLAKVELLPHIPFTGQLVFHYPAKEIEANPQGLLEVHELGRGFDYAKSLGGVRLHL